MYKATKAINLEGEENMFPWNVGSLFTCKSTRRYNLEDIFTAVKA
jgi:hypothetical protein